MRVVLITGVAGGIGRATAQYFQAHGWCVIGVDRLYESHLSGVTRFVHANIAQEEDVIEIFQDVARTEGRLDALINNAAIQIPRPLVQTTRYEWELTFASNVTGAFLAIREAYPLLKTRGGAVINVCSVHALATSTLAGAYAASKSALLGLTRVAALELAAHNIRVNAVLPGAVDTPMLRDGLKSHFHSTEVSLDELVETLGKKHAVGRVGRPEEIAQAILFLADTDRSAYITGQTLVVDGGAMAALSTEANRSNKEDSESPGL